MARSKASSTLTPSFELIGDIRRLHLNAESKFSLFVTHGLGSRRLGSHMLRIRQLQIQRTQFGLFHLRLVDQDLGSLGDYLLTLRMLGQYFLNHACLAIRDQLSMFRHQPNQGRREIEEAQALRNTCLCTIEHGCGFGLRRWIAFLQACVARRTAVVQIMNLGRAGLAAVLRAQLARTLLRFRAKFARWSSENASRTAPCEYDARARRYELWQPKLSFSGPGWRPASTLYCDDSARSNCSDIMRSAVSSCASLPCC